VDPRFFEQLDDEDFGGPFSLHVEYLPEANVAENLEALQSDLTSLRSLLA
jgi:hypothetical protein